MQLKYISGYLPPSTVHIHLERLESNVYILHNQLKHQEIKTLQEFFIKNGITSREVQDRNEKHETARSRKHSTF